MHVGFRTGERVSVRKLIVALLNFELDQEVEICCYTSIGDEDEMVIYEDLIDRKGNTPCQICKKIGDVGVERDGKTVAIG